MTKEWSNTVSEPQTTQAMHHILPPDLTDMNADSSILSEDTTESFSDESYAALFPNFRFSIHAISALCALMTTSATVATKRSAKVSLLLVVLEIEELDAVRLKAGPEAGQEVGLLKLIAGDDKGAVLKVAAWRETAELWSGSEEAEHPGIKKGDIICLSSVFFLTLDCTLQLIRGTRRCVIHRGTTCNAGLDRFTKACVIS